MKIVGCWGWGRGGGGFETGERRGRKRRRRRKGERKGRKGRKGRRRKGKRRDVLCCDSYGLIRFDLNVRSKGIDK